MKKLFAVLGDPIAHSMSPAMHNDLFAYYHIDAVYVPVHVKAEVLEDAVKGLRAMGAAGFNVTVPHKSAIIPFLDGVDELALRIGAVNTVVNENGKLIGYNTDGPGFIKSLQKIGSPVSNRKILIIGAGGAARAIYFSLAQYQQEEIDIANRTFEKAQKIVQECPFPVSSTALSLNEASQRVENYDLIIQTTKVGMFPKVQEQPIELLKLKNQVHVCDIIYNPLYTQFLQEAERMGATIQNGVDTLVFQGALAFEKWTGIFPDVQRMNDHVLKLLGGTEC